MPPAPGVAGVHAPAFVERKYSPSRTAPAPGVAGVHAPAFVERRPTAGTAAAASGVAGVHAPAFVQRRKLTRCRGIFWSLACRRGSRPGLRSADTAKHACNGAQAVSPGFTPRPSLSGARWRWKGKPHRVSPGFTPRPSFERERKTSWSSNSGTVSPGFTPRPSLSDQGRADDGRGLPGIAGVHAPAFVERPSSTPGSPSSRCVAGVHAPAFVERRCRACSAAGG